MRLGWMLGCLLVLLPLGAGVAQTAPNEKALWQLWELKQENPEDHKTIIKACLAYKKQNPSDPFVAVTSTLAGWHLLKLDLDKQAVAMMAPFLSLEGSGLAEGARTMAQTWVTRVDREAITEVLQEYYKKEVRYPSSLRELPAEANLPMTDRFDQPWKYKLAGFKSIPGLFDQKYELQSGKLGIDSVLEDALAFPYGETTHITPVGMKAADVVEVVRGRDLQGPRIAVNAGRRIDDVLIAYVGRHILVLCNRDHWTVVRKPE